MTREGRAGPERAVVCGHRARRCQRPALRAATTNARLVVSLHLVQRFLVQASDAKFRRWFTMGDARTLAERLLGAAEVVDEPSNVPHVVEGDPSDDYLVALAREHRAVLLTRDRGIHRSLSALSEPRALDPAELLTAIGGEPSDGPC